MKEQTFNIIPTSDTGELIIRNGEALKLEPPLSVVLQGTITAPGDFAAKRRVQIPPLETHVIADYTDRYIHLRVLERDKYGYSVEGRLDLHPELKLLSINRNSLYTSRGLYDQLKFKGAYFKNKEQHLALLTRLREFDAQVSQEFVNSTDFKGASALSRVTNIKTNLALEFTLAIPIFTGFGPKEFDVEICVDLKDGGVVFWLESVQLHEMITFETEVIFERELKRLSDYIIIKQY